eukprot:scaffold55476_cov22-Cyclotella_meneghiniana.AAC.3
MNEAQTAFLCLYAAYLIVILLFHNTFLLYPFRLLTTFLHEISHAIACWITCGEVYKIKVFDNEGGVTQYAGGCRVLVIPAGYVGSAIWGSVFVMLSGGRKTSTGAAGFLDTLSRTVLHSDAYACYEQCNCCLPKCIGMQWAIINILLQITGVWIALVQMSNECQDMEWIECLSGDLQWDSPWEMNTDQIYEWKNQAQDMFN